MQPTSPTCSSGYMGLLAGGGKAGLCFAEGNSALTLTVWNHNTTQRKSAVQSLIKITFPTEDSSAMPCPQSPVYLQGVCRHNLVRDGAMVTRHAGIASTTLSNFLCLAYHCRIAVQAPFPSLRSSAVPQAQWLLLTPARAVWIMPALRGDSSFSCTCLKACSKSAYFNLPIASKPEKIQLPWLWLIWLISKFKKHECLLVGWICNLQMTG